jgi:hypothetical protein
MAEVAQYRVLFYGGAEGYEERRAEVYLYGEDGERLGSIRFYDPEMSLPDDRRLEDGTITMHLGSEMLKNVIDILRNEKPIEFRRFFESYTKLGTPTKEPVGEEE